MAPSNLEILRRALPDSGPADVDALLKIFTTRWHQSGKGKETGARVENRTWQVFDFRDGKIVHCRGYPAKDEALQAVRAMGRGGFEPPTDGL